ncbi:MAG: MerC domain-containing protein [Bacteroidota bacterium]|nr:MerC domain-containing protein [Candidatus Kapabacteria bacterium]MDW8218937.1 MerC domain-containing protein [Bacteroidota bacterium]
MHQYTKNPLPPSLADRIGIALSSICAFHCLILPTLLPLLGTLAHYFESDWTHTLLAALIIPTVGLTAWRGYKHHGKWEVLWLLVIGALAILCALLLQQYGISKPTETAITTLGSAFLITGHWKNYKHCSLCAAGKPHTH